MMDTPAPPSRRRILAATAVALVTAVVVLVTAVLPAEYGIDPLGTGKMLGLTALAGTADDETLSPSTLAAVRSGVNTPQPGLLARDTFTVELRPFEGVEYTGTASSKAAASCTRGRRPPEVSYDFHGEPDGAPPKYSESYGQGAGRSAQGVFIAPTPGIHGWFWENKGAGRVTITLTTAGFYRSSTEYRDGERRERTFGGD